MTILAVSYVIPFLPYFLSFAAGAMLYVVVEELIPEMSQGKHSNIGTIMFAVGFSLMMALDVMNGKLPLVIVVLALDVLYVLGEKLKIV